LFEKVGTSGRTGLVCQRRVDPLTRRRRPRQKTPGELVDLDERWTDFHDLENSEVPVDPGGASGLGPTKGMGGRGACRKGARTRAASVGGAEGGHPKLPLVPEGLDLRIEALGSVVRSGAWTSAIARVRPRVVVAVEPNPRSWRSRL
jgi:hypothetical protein